MVDTYTMLLWVKPNEDDIEIQTKQVYNLLSILSKVNYLRPKYLTASNKKNVTEFELSFENVKKLITRKKDKQFSDLGSRLSFFTSLNDSESVGISITVGVSNPKFLNSLVINFNIDIKKQKNTSFNELANVFKELINACTPFYGCFTCKSNRNMFNGYYNDGFNIPNSIFDLNFWGKNVISKLAVNEEILSKMYEYEKIKGGYYIRLQKNPIDTTNTQHMEFQKQVNCMMGIN